jgi:methylthioribose-1-phosphate isomerase
MLPWIDRNLHIPQEFSVVEITSLQRHGSRAYSHHDCPRRTCYWDCSGLWWFISAQTEIQTDDRDQFLTPTCVIANELRATRPTAANLFWAIGSDEMKNSQTLGTVAHLRQVLPRNRSPVKTTESHL